MIVVRILTPQLRKELKKPLGPLFQGSLDEIMTMLKILIGKEKPAKIVTIGDQVSQDLTDHAILPDILIVDNKIMRKEISPILATADRVINVTNPAGTITDEAWSAMEKAATDVNRTKIVVNGEEDLLTLVAILTVPDNSLICYGQPNEGVVAVKVTARLKQKACEIINAMISD